MYVKVCGVIAALVVTLPLLCQPAKAQAQRWCYAGYFHDDGNTLKVLNEGKPDEFWKAPCQDDECRAIKDIGCAVDAQAHRHRPNFMAYNSVREAVQARAQYGRNVRALGREHPGRIPLYCTLLARVAATIGDPEHDGTAASDIMRLAVMLDRPHHHCLAQVEAAVPKSVTQPDVLWGRTCLRTIKACKEEMRELYTD